MKLKYKLLSLFLVMGAIAWGSSLIFTAHETHEEPGTAMISEFNADTYVSIPKIGPIDMSITKPVLYILLAGLICCLFAVWQARRMQVKPDGKQTFVEVMYDFLYTQIARSTLDEKLFSRYMPYLAALFLFIWVNNLISFIPLPFGAEHFSGESGLRTFGLYAATSNINLTIVLAMMTIVLTHYLGIKHLGFFGYFKSWVPGGGHPDPNAPKPSMLSRTAGGAGKGAMFMIHAVTEASRPISLSVRLFANMLCGHMLILVMFTIVFVVGHTWVAAATVPVAIVFFLFEVVLVATLQAFIFAILSGVYLGGAVQAEH